MVITDEHINMYLFDLSGKPVSARQVMGFFGISETLTGKTIDSLILKSPDVSATSKPAKQNRDYLQVAFDPQELIAGRQLRFGLLNLPGKVHVFLLTPIIAVREGAQRGKHDPVVGE